MIQLVLLRWVWCTRFTIRGFEIFDEQIQTPNGTNPRERPQAALPRGALRLDKLVDIMGLIGGCFCVVLCVSSRVLLVEEKEAKAARVARA